MIGCGSIRRLWFADNRVVDPFVYDVLGARVAHVPPVAPRDEILLLALGRHDDVVFDREDRVLHAVNEEQLARRPPDDAGVDQAESVGVGGVLGDRCRRVGVAVPELIRERIGQGEWVLHLVLGTDPSRVEHVMTSAALRHDGEQPICVRVGDAERVVATCADATSDDLLLIELVSRSVRGHPVDDAAHEPIRRRRVVRRRGTVTGTWDFKAQRCVAPVNVFLHARRVVGLVGVQPADEEHDGPPALWFRALGQTKVCLDGDVAITRGRIDVRERDIDRDAGWVELLPTLFIGNLALFPGFLAERRSVDRESRDPVDRRRTQKEIPCLAGAAFRHCVLRLGDELLRDWEERLGVVVRSIQDARIVIRDFAQLGENPVEIPDFRVGERVNASGTWRTPLLEPER